jgi:hypothetical protein
MATQDNNLLVDKDDPLGLTDDHRKDSKWECPLTVEVYSAEKVAEWDRHTELVMQQCVKEFSASPLYQARAAKDPNYWKEFSMGVVHLYKTEDDEA